jgi:hypothetical protein
VVRRRLAAVGRRGREARAEPVAQAHSVNQVVPVHAALLFEIKRKHKTSLKFFPPPPFRTSILNKSTPHLVPFVLERVHRLRLENKIEHG